ncbi:MAG TPA: acyl-CoA reductase [Candidatus Baltobacteraceae bacterium]|nr:acyl-CoA reductase [Candidatus Baltobacteraceae bacterium]
MTALAQTPVRKIVRAISDAAERWSDADFPPRVRVTDRIAERTGYSVPVVEYALDRLFLSITANELEATIRGELGSVEILDDFAVRAGRPDAYAAPVGSVCVISSRTTIGVAIVPAVFALCAKCDVVVKDREDSLVRAFFDSLAEELEPFAKAARANVWSSGGNDAPDLTAFEAVVAFGADDTLSAIASRMRSGARFIGYGSRASAGYVAREVLSDRTAAAAIARGAARDLVLYESEGCLSLHVLFVERNAALSVQDFGALFAAALEEANVEFPIGRRDEGAIAAISHLRNVAAFRAAGGNGAVFANENADFAVVVDQPPSEPPPFLPRTIGIIAVDGPDDALAYLRAHGVLLEAFALSGDRADLVRGAVEAGAVRLARFGELQHPLVSGDHGGRPRIAEFIRWIDKSL